MKALTVFLGVLLCLVAVQARHYTDRNENEKINDELTENIESARDVRGRQMKHRRKRWGMNYGYDYSPPQYGYYPDRRDYDHNQDLIPQILRLLDEISAYVKRPQPPPVTPQPIYVPYPMPYPVPQKCTCNIKVESTPNITRRFPEMEDPNQNWGITTNEQEEEEEGDGARPISFEPIQPKRPVQRPPPIVEHGSSQAAASNVVKTQTSRERTVTKSAGICNAAILTCCSDPDRKACFTRMGCGMTFSKGNACTPESIAGAIESFKKAYSPS